MNIPGFLLVTRPGKRLRFATEAMAIEIVDLPSYKKMVIFHGVLSNSLPEGKS